MGAVLIVEDNVGMAQAVKTLVSVNGHRASVAYSGELAMAYVREHADVDLVILDVSMPGMSGLDVLRRWGAEGRLPDLPVLMFSASEQHRDESLRLGAVEFVLKHKADDLPALIKQFANCDARVRVSAYQNSPSDPA